MKKQPMYTIMLVLTVFCTLAAVSTLIPQASASSISMLGYKAHCPLAPVSTVMCLLLAGLCCRIRAKKYKTG